MKNKYLILIGMVLLSGMFFACSNEEAIHSLATKPCSLTLTMSDVASKASTIASGYAEATVDEVTINTCFIGFYADINKAPIAYANTSETNKGTLEKVSDGKYTISGIVVPITDKAITIYVVANPPTGANYAALSLTTLKQQVVSYTSPSEFIASADNLIKTGDTTLAEGISEGINNINVDLTQLAAKVRVVLTFTEKVKEIVGDAIINDGEHTGSLVDIFNKVAEGNGNVDNYVKDTWMSKFISSCKNDDNHSTLNVFYPNGTIAKVTESGAKWIKVQNLDSVQTKTTETWTLGSPTTIAVNNIRVSSALNGGGAETLLSYPSPGSFDGNELDITFYTYKREHLENSDSERLNVQVNGSLIPTNISMKRTKKGNLHGAWGNKETGIVHSGWGNGNQIFPVVGEVFSTEDWSAWASVGTPESGTPIPNQNFQAFINPKDGILPGHYYYVTGTLKPNVSYQVDLEWEVLDWASKTVNIPGFQ